MKYSFTKQALEALRVNRHDEGFVQRNLLRIQISSAAIRRNELKRVGQNEDTTMKNIDWEKGTFEVDAIVIAKDIKNVVRRS